MGYIDIIHAEVHQTNWNTPVFEMTVVSPIPLNPGVPTVCLLWFLDTDRNPNTGGGEQEPPGVDYSVRVQNDNDGRGWYGYIIETGSTCRFSISKNTVSVTVQLSQIGYPTSFKWWSGTYSYWDGMNPATNLPYIMNDGTDFRI